jgi:hypothetical protein
MGKTGGIAGRIMLQKRISNERQQSLLAGIDRPGAGPDKILLRRPAIFGSAAGSYRMGDAARVPVCPSK